MLAGKIDIVGEINAGVVLIPYIPFSCIYSRMVFIAYWYLVFCWNLKRCSIKSARSISIMTPSGVGGHNLLICRVPKESASPHVNHEIIPESEIGKALDSIVGIVETVFLVNIVGTATAIPSRKISSVFGEIINKGSAHPHEIERLGRYLGLKIVGPVSPFVSSFYWRVS